MKGYFLVVDILGFSQLVKNLNPSELDEKIRNWINIVETTCRSLNIERYQLISDTLFIGVGDGISEFNQLVELSSRLLGTSITHSLPLRGAISFGEYSWSKELVYGQAVIDAHEHEMNQDWVGISCVEGLDLPLPLDNIVVYSLPLKSGPNRHGAAVVWDIPSYEDLAALLCSGGLSEPDKPLSSKWFNRVEKTILFSMYIKLAIKQGFPKDKFGGFSPLHSISKFLEQAL